MKKLPKISITLILGMLLIFSFSFNIGVYSATTGKIQGTITDAQSKEGLPGVNVTLEGTTMGAATDANGFFFIINVPVGTYQLKASIVGYAVETKSDVRVYVDRTTTTDFALKSQAVAGQEVTVTAERVPVPLDVSSTEAYIRGEDITESSVTRFDQMISLQAGVVFQGDIETGEGFQIRGGDISESDVQVDGISMRDEFTKIPNLAVSRNLIQDVQILTGGFNAEYGNVRSGLINVISKDGSYNRYSGVFEGRISPADRKHWGTGPYDWNAWIYQNYLGSNWHVWDADATGRKYVGAQQVIGWGTSSVYNHTPYIAAYDADLAANKANPGLDYLNSHPYSTAFVGWNSVVSSKPYTRESAIDIFKWEYRGKEYGKSPDQMLDLGGGGPVPYLKNTKFYASTFWNRSFYVIPMAREFGTEMTNTFKLTNRIKSNMNLVVNFQYTYVRAASAYGENATPTYGYATGDNTSVGYSGSEGNAIWDESSNFPRKLNNYYGQLKFTHTYSPSTYYDITLGFTRGLNHQDRIRERDLTKIKFIDDTKLAAAGWKEKKLNWVPATADVAAHYEPVDAGLAAGRIGLDERPRGHWDVANWGYGSNSISSAYTSAFPGNWMDLDSEAWERINTSTFTLSSNLVSQVNKYNQIKAGFELYRFHIYDIAYNGYGVTTDITQHPSWFDIYKGDPWEFDAYIQDKLEWEGMIMNWGLRATSWFPEVKGYNITDNNMYTDTWIASKQWPNENGRYVEGQANYKWQNQRTRDIKHRLLLQPRFGVSHPITESSKIFFNYGHFYQRPTYRQMYYTGWTTVPVPDVPWPKTVSYEIGYSQSIYNQILLQISGYYKDYTEDASTFTIQSYYTDVTFNTQTTNGYRDVRGLEFRLERSFGRFINGWANYNYMIQSYGATGLRYSYENQTKASQELTSLVQTRPEVRPTFRLSLTLRTPVNFGPGPAILGVKPLAEWRLNTIFSWRDGGEFPQPGYQTIPADLVKYIQRVDRKMVELYIRKRIANGADFYINVMNLFNIKYYTPTSGYTENLRFPWSTQPGNDKYGVYDRYYVQTYGRDGWQMWEPNKRDVYLGIRYQF